MALVLEMNVFMYADVFKKQTSLFSYSTISEVMCTLEISRAPFTPEFGVQCIFTV